MSQRVATVTQDPDERLHYSLDWTDQLATGDTIASSTWTYGTLTTSSSEANTTTTTTSKKITGGTSGTDYTVENTVTTTGGDILQASILVRVRTNA